MQAALRISCAIGAIALSAAANAQQAAPVNDGIDDIVVTATRMGSTALQDTPLAVTAFDSRTLEVAGIKDVRDLVSLTPNLQVTQNASFVQVYIRGIGSNNVFGGSDPSATIHLDGIYMARPSSYLTNFLDVERIEVLRGPQGTLYGRNSIGGTINVVSRKPTNDLKAQAQLSYGNYNFARAEAYVSGALIQDKLAASLSVIASRRDGYLENIVPGVGDADDESTIGARGQLRFTPDDKLEIILRADYMKSDDALAGYIKLLQTTTDPLANSILGDYRKIAVDIRPSSERRQWGTAAEINYELSDTVLLKSLTGYRANRLTQVGDTDGTALRVRRTDQFEDQHQFSQEFTLSGKTGGLSYIGGLYYFDETIEVISTVNTFATVRANFSPTIKTKAWAGFGQASYAVTDEVSLTAGLRYTHETKSFVQRALQSDPVTSAPRPGFPRGYSSEDTYNAWTPKFSIEYRPNDDVLLYASATKGFKSGGFNFSSLNAAQGFAPESLWSYEAGAKLDLLDHKLRLNTTYFHYVYKDLQVQSFLSPGVVDITNASDAKVDGIEIEAQARPATWLQLGGNLAWLDARYVNYTTALRPGNIAFDASGNTLNLAPKWAWTLYGQVDTPVGNGSMFARAEYSHRSEQFFTASNSGLDVQEGYGLFNASAGYTFPGDVVQLMVFGRNLGDTEYVTSTASFASGIVGRVGEPRTFGVRAIVRY